MGVCKCTYIFKDLWKVSSVSRKFAARVINVIILWYYHSRKLLKSTKNCRRDFVYVCESHFHEAQNGLANDSISAIIHLYQSSIRACVHALFSLG